MEAIACFLGIGYCKEITVGGWRYIELNTTPRELGDKIVFDVGVRSVFPIDNLLKLTALTNKEVETHTVDLIDAGARPCEMKKLKERFKKDFG